ncbi:Protein CWC15 -like protein A [Halotydeus destructor]|nr:Protein CWC15 -like protein A [Halotydeus destructor]
MTTAARPTWDTAKGGSGRGEKSLGALSKQYSSRDLPGHTKLKYRQSGQNTTDDLKEKDFRRELEERERVISREKESSKRGSSAYEASSSRSSAILPPPKRSKPEPLPSTSFDGNDNDEDESDNAESSDDDSDEDDTAELLAELNRIKRERAAEESKKEQEKKVQEEKIRMENILSGNPLLSSTKSDFSVKRRWDDDVVFKNCARSEPDRNKQTYINDTLRSEFHKKFMEKYIK